MTPRKRPMVRTDIDGMAVIGRTLHDLRGIRYVEGEGGNAPADDAAGSDKAGGDDADAAKETDWKAEARKWESRAKENSTAAQRLAEIEEANKTEAQKAVERAEKAEKALAEREAAEELAKAREDVAKAAGVPASILRGASKDELEAHAAELKPHFTASKGPVIPGQGNSPTRAAAGSDSDEERAAARALFGGGTTD